MATKKKAQPAKGTVTSPERKATSGKKTVKQTVSNDIIGSNVAQPEKIIDINLTKAPAKAEKETVAIYSTKNVNWEGVGKLEKGYNIVNKKTADQWLTRSHTRIATPEEVAREYGA
jgi:hypothetical protein